MRLILLLVLGALAAPGLAPAQDRAHAEYERQRTRALAENGQRHLQLGSWARDAGLVQQATAEFLLAVEVAEGKNPGAVQVLGIMRSLDEAFWTKQRQRPSRALLDQYEKRAKRARREDREARFAVAKLAHGKKLEQEALREFRALVGDVDEALEVDKKGRIVLDVGVVPDDVSTRLLADAVTIDERRYAREDDLVGLPDAATIHEHASDGLRVRGTLPAERIVDLHALGEALLPHLEQRIGGRPVRRVKVFVFATRAEYAAYLAANALQRFAPAGGFADYAAQQAIVCAEGTDENGLAGLFLHELVHLYDYQVTPTSLPSWYTEAFAECVGGPGAYRWEAGKLTVEGRMSAEQRRRLVEGLDDFSLRTLLESDAGALWTQDSARARRFYVEAWGFLEFLRTGAGDAVAARFAVWESMCRGKALGAEARSPGERRKPVDAREARHLFTDMFGAELDELQQKFMDWARGER